MANESRRTVKKAPAKLEKSQRQRFIDFAREHGADDPDALDKALGEIGAVKRKVRVSAPPVRKPERADQAD